ncbi:hypothetical protein BBD42_18000 [Paenibacillus sp. BIHB 4019]|uniref:Uncharacterized protein n=1 Tax=Paenibacillus sp. BIHB 4019 TaxID=1870819 RepID=A0A1B2DKE8_9BACL|nr:hypothetical protein [Paenibacillus sp. BIHB 4019]ANY68155.1 hypothetical protein BBD42_18000 [Paenibacillus sp. BIHB 4019]
MVKLDISNDYYIGYDTNANKTVVIPKDKIIKIENFQSSKGIKKQLISFENLNDEDKNIISTLQSYYYFKINAPDLIAKCTTVCNEYEEFKSLLSNTYFKHNFDASDPIILKYLSNKSFRSKNITEHFGNDFSIPESENNDTTLKTVYVKEHWNNDIFHVKYTLQKSDEVNKNQWVVISQEEEFFKFE